jgi:hypothetical protein
MCSMFYIILLLFQKEDGLYIRAKWVSLSSASSATVDQHPATLAIVFLAMILNISWIPIINHSTFTHLVAHIWFGQVTSQGGNIILNQRRVYIIPPINTWYIIVITFRCREPLHVVLSPSHPKLNLSLSTYRFFSGCTNCRL